MKYLSKILFAFTCVSFAIVAQGCPPDTVCITAAPYVDPYQTPAPQTSGGFMGISAQAAAQAEGRRIARQNCLDQIQKEAGQFCKDKVEFQLQADLSACNKNAVFGGIVAFGGGAGAGIALAVLGSTPIGWGVAAVSVIVGGGAMWASLWGENTCHDAADAANRYNLETACPAYIKAGQDKTCPQL